MNEDIKQYKISVPLIDIEELTTIDNYYNEIVNEYLEKCLKEKEEIIVQRIMMNLRKGLILPFFLCVIKYCRGV